MSLADKIAVNIIFNERNICRVKQGNEFLLTRDGHTGAQRVLHCRGGQNGGRAVAPNGVRQRFQQQALNRIGGDR